MNYFHQIRDMLEHIWNISSTSHLRQPVLGRKLADFLSKMSAYTAWNLPDVKNTQWSHAYKCPSSILNVCLLEQIFSSFARSNGETHIANSGLSSKVFSGFTLSNVETPSQTSGPSTKTNSGFTLTNDEAPSRIVVSRQEHSVVSRLQMLKAASQTVVSCQKYVFVSGLKMSKNALTNWRL